MPQKMTYFAIFCGSVYNKDKLDSDIKDGACCRYHEVDIAFFSGLQMMCIGMVGQYIAKIYQESKHRPHLYCP